jgi:DNA-binding NarL/FixJ family response regulator
VKRPRILLADDCAPILERYCKTLHSDFEVVETAGNGESAVRAAHRSRADIIIMDILMPVLNGVEACRQLRKTLKGAPVILVSAHADLGFIMTAFQAGAAGYVLKDEAASELPGAIRTVLGGHIHITPSLHPVLWDDKTASPEHLGGLTDRQRQLVALIGRGLTTKEVGSVMGIAFKTVVRRRAAAMRRLQMAQVTELFRYAVRCRLSVL